MAAVKVNQINMKKRPLYREDLTRVVISYEIYETSLRPVS